MNAVNKVLVVLDRTTSPRRLGFNKPGQTDFRDL